LVGFDDHPWMEVSDPPLTVVRQPAQHIGWVAARTLLALINGERLSPSPVTLECELILRQSHGLGC